jgi:hypothetical protein
MKNSGLHNRFNEDHKYVWLFHDKCMWCGGNRWDALHHIISPSSMDWKETDSNNSILNSCPIHNFVCHIDNPMLHNVNYERKLLRKTLDALFKNDYKLSEKDREFIKVYYESHFKYIKIPFNTSPESRRFNNKIKKEKKAYRDNLAKL